MIFSTLERTWLIIFVSLVSIYLRVICIKFDWIKSTGSTEKSLKMISVFLLFRYHPPLDIGYPLHLNKFQFPLPKDNLGQVWLKLTQWF
jgi:hypothetical protein